MRTFSKFLAITAIASVVASGAVSAALADGSEMLTRADGSELVGKDVPVSGSWSYTFASWDGNEAHGILPTVTVVKAPQHGSISTSVANVGETPIVGTALTYTPQAGYHGADSITYQVAEQVQKGSYNTVTNTYTVNLAVR